MDQVSRPLLFALAATIALAALWLVALRPTPAEVADLPPLPTQAAAQAQGAAAASDAANAELQAATGGTPAGAAPGAAAPGSASAPAASAAPPAKAAAPADIEAASKREVAVVRDIRRGKVVVMLFWNAKAADDIATREGVRALDRHQGKVAVHIVPIGRVGQYESITQGVTINQTPTTLVIDRRRRTRSIIGFTERGELTQAVNDALAIRR